jgi:hypothetical protein
MRGSERRADQYGEVRAGFRKYFSEFQITWKQFANPIGEMFE